MRGHPFNPDEKKLLELIDALCDVYDDLAVYREIFNLNIFKKKKKRKKNKFCCF